MPDPAIRPLLGYGCSLVRGRGRAGWAAVVTWERPESPLDDERGAATSATSWCGADHQTQAGAILEALDRDPSSTQARNEILTGALRSLGLDVDDTLFYDAARDTLAETAGDALPHALGPAGRYRIERRHGEDPPMYLTAGALWAEDAADAGTWERDVALFNLQGCGGRVPPSAGHVAFDLVLAPG